MLERGFFAALVVAVLLVAGHQMRTPEVNLYGNPDFTTHQGLLLHRGRPFNGTTKETFPSGAVFRTTSYRNGLKHGPSEEFGTTGARRALLNFSEGKKEGVQKGWYIEGPREFERHYRSGLLEGVSTDWYLNGQISKQQTYKAGAETALKVLYQTGEVFTNYVVRGPRTYGVNNGDVCMDFSRDGEIK